MEGGDFESIDQNYVSRHFHSDGPVRIADKTYFNVLQDHLTDGSLPALLQSGIGSRPDHRAYPHNLKRQENLTCRVPSFRSSFAY